MAEYFVGWRIEIEADLVIEGMAVNDPVVIFVPSNSLMTSLLGQGDKNILQVEAAFPNTKVHARGNQLTIDGPDSPVLSKLIHEWVVVLESGELLDEHVVTRSIDMVRADIRPSEVLTSRVARSTKGKYVKPKTAGQKSYTDAIAKNIITFGIGPAGTGKSYLAVALAVQALQDKSVNRIILTRPAVEAGERLGFLPGDLMAKVDPYLRPLYDALNDMLDPETVARFIEKGIIEIAPLAFMRGRTLNSSFIILDEAQNTTPEQMKMFLTRIGFGSKVVVTGDVTQVDLAGGKSGLADIAKILDGIEGISFVYLGKGDVVRHRIVSDIVAAYESSEVRR